MEVSRKVIQALCIQQRRGKKSFFYFRAFKVAINSTEVGHIHCVKYCTYSLGEPISTPKF